MANTLATQALALVEACTAALKAPNKTMPGAVTIAQAKAIVDQARKQRPDDPTLAAINFQGTVPDWGDILAAMELIYRTF